MAAQTPSDHTTSRGFSRPAAISKEPLARGWFDEPRNRPRVLLLFAVAHAGAVVLGFEYYFEPEIVATFWPASGLLLGALLVSRVGNWPAVLLVALLAKSIPSVLLYDLELGANLLFGLAESAEALMGATALRWWFGPGFSLTRLAEVSGLTLAAAVASPAISALGGAAIVTGGFGGPAYWKAWQLWWLADGMGVLLVAPLVVLFSRRLARWLTTLRGWRLAELAALAATLPLSHLIFGKSSLALSTALEVPYAFFPVLIWATIRFPPWIAASCTFLLATLVVWNADQGRGPFVLDGFSVYQIALTIQVFLAVTALSVLALAAALASRARLAVARRTSDTTLRIMLESASDPVLISMDNRYVDCNDKLLEMLKASKADILGKTPWEIAPPRQESGADSETNAKELLAQFERGELSLTEWRLQAGDGTLVDVEVSVAGVEVAGEKLRISYLRDITDRKRAERATRERMRFESLISNLSARFVNISADRVDEEVVDALRAIGEHLDIDRCTLYQLERDQLTLSHSWDRGLGLPKRLKRTWFPFTAGKIRAGEVLAVEDLGSLPPEAAGDVRRLREIGVQSFVTFPLLTGDTVLGGVTFEAHRAPRRFSKELVQRLRLTADVFANALARKKAEGEIRDRLEFERLISDLSAGFVNLPAHQVDRVIEESLRSICQHLSFDLSRLYQVREGRLELTHSWLDEPSEVFDRLGRSKVGADRDAELQQLAQRLLAGDPLVIPDVGKLPDETSTDRRKLLAEGIRAMIIFPLTAGETTIGHVHFASLKGPRDFDRAVVQRLQLAADILASALARKRADRAVEESEEKFFKAFHASPSPSAITRLSDHRHLDVNDAWVHATGYSREEALGKTTEQLALWPTEGESTRLLEDFKTGRPDARIAGRFQRRDGSELFLEVSAVLIEVAAEPCVLSVATDLTDRENASREIARLKDELEQERDYLREEVKSARRFGEIVGESPVVLEMLGRIDAVAATEATVLILGESGAGKELVATAIHSQSSRGSGPLVRVNCASVPPNLFESEFFGHVRGAFTGAARDRVGRFQLAHRGTLFLDEIAEIPLSLQSKLLRALQDGEVQRVGEEASRKVDVRVIAATNRELESEIKRGRFREDLFYRLNVFPIRVPPLRERGRDIVLLAQHFSEEISRRLGREALTLSRFQAEKLLDYAWPGNIRELRNVIEKAVILSTGKRLQFDLAAIRASSTTVGSTGAESSKVAAYVPYDELERRERENLIAALEAAAWKVSGPGGAAELLGIKPSTLTSKMKKLEIKKASGKARNA